MIARVSMFLLALMPITGNIDASIWDYFFSSEVAPDPKTIKVLIVDDKPSAMLEVRGKYSLYDPHKKKHISARFLGKRKPVQAASEGVRWGEEFPGIHQLLIAPEEDTTTIVIDGIHYRGIIYVYAIDGKVSIVNEVVLDDYLNSVLSVKYPGTLPEEMSAAIAIAERTNALFCATKSKSPYWSVDAHHVNYYGEASVKTTSSIVRAINATRQMVMSVSKKAEGLNPFPAGWMASSAENKSEIKLAQISLIDAENLAKNGKDAAEILKKAFPGTSLQLTE